MRKGQKGVGGSPTHNLREVTTMKTIAENVLVKARMDALEYHADVLHDAVFMEAMKHQGQAIERDNCEEYSFADDSSLIWDNMSKRAYISIDNDYAYM
jgi:hypothetical protein